jgi:hypothetical protein
MPALPRLHQTITPRTFPAPFPHLLSGFVVWRAPSMNLAAAGVKHCPAVAD